MEWASVIVTISMEMVVPGLIGYWLDQRLGTVVLFVLLGFAGGMTLAVWHLVRLTGKSGRANGGQRPKGPDNEA
jgi:F0F1-type ATP synthase assembly protein I